MARSCTAISATTLTRPAPPSRTMPENIAAPQTSPRSCTRRPERRFPTALDYYIDWQALARDMALNGEIMVFQTGFDEVHVFWSR